MLKFAKAKIEETIKKNFNLESKDVIPWMNVVCDFSFFVVTVGFTSFTNAWAMITEPIAGIADITNMAEKYQMNFQ